MAEKQRKIIRPQAGFQEKFVRSNVDVCFGGGSLGGGKSYASLLSLAEWSLNPKFRACFTRRNLDSTKIAGGLVDDFISIYGKSVNVKISDSPRGVFPSGAWVDFTHIADEDPKKLMERIKGWQYDMVNLDEITSYLNFSTFKIFATRVRGKAGIGSKIRGTTNPKKSHWIRIFLDWYIGEDGYIIPERDGVVRYFFITGEDVESVVWGGTKREVYDKCKPQIDKLLKSTKGVAKYEDFIKSFVFYRGSIDENQALLANGKDYLGNVAMMGEKQTDQLLSGNWNIDEDDDDDSLPIPTNTATQVFANDLQTNNDWWITVDLAGQGKDNTIMIVWNGFHIMDVMMLNISDAQGNATACKVLAEKWNIAHSRIIFDATNGMYFKSYISEARPFISRNSARGLYKTTYQYMKDECAFRLTEMIKGGYISFSEKVANMQYKHQKLTSYTTIKTEFIQECYALRFKDKGNGKRALYTKVEMNAILGKGRSMDLLDPCIMRMMPIVSSVIGEEIFWDIDDRQRTNNDSFQQTSYGRGESIYDLLED